VQHHQHQRASSQSRFLPKSIPPFIINAASSTHTHHANKAQEMHKTQETHISNREGKSHRVEKQSMGLLCMGLLCMGLQCLVYEKNAGVVVFYGWVAWRRD
jgi:hypothetical protein